MKQRVIYWHELRRGVMAYIGEHHDVDIDEEETWNAAIKAVIGERPREVMAS